MVAWDLRWEANKQRNFSVRVKAGALAFLHFRIMVVKLWLALVLGLGLCYVMPRQLKIGEMHTLHSYAS